MSPPSSRALFNIRKIVLEAFLQKLGSGGGKMAMNLAIFNFAKLHCENYVKYLHFFDKYFTLCYLRVALNFYLFLFKE